MAFPLAAVGMGLNFIGGLSGLLGAGSAVKRQQLARDLALRDMQLGGEQDYADARSAGQRDVTGLAGTLRSGLGALRRGLYSEGAESGLYGPNSAIEGALANQGAASAQALGSYTSSLSDTLARLRNQNRMNLGQMRSGYAANDLNYAREQQAGAAGGLASLLGSLGQMSFGQSGGQPYNPNNSGAAMNGNRNSVLDMPAPTLPVYNSAFQPIGQGKGLNYKGFGKLSYANMFGK